MFEFLSKLPAADATGGVYYAMRIIKHVKQLGELPYDYLLEAPSEPSDEEAKLKDRIIQQIEQTEHLPLKNIPKHVIETYVQRLAKELQSVLRQQWRYDKGRGTQLLQQLRRTTEQVGRF
jgi:hypothetical protein